MKVRTMAAAGVLAAAALTAGSGVAVAATTHTSAPAASTASAAHGAKRVVITISSFDFKVTGAVRPGGTIVVHNKDGVAHTVTSNKGGVFNVYVKGGGSATFKAPKKAGKYAYHCNFHSEMHGVLTVR